MEDYNVQDNAFTNKATTLLNRMLVIHQRMKIDRIKDVSFCRDIDFLSSQVENTKLLINEAPRFDWVSIQNKIDALYQTDRNISGVNLNLRWGEGENMGFLNCKIGKAS
jgi:hypothetical protein